MPFFWEPFVHVKTSTASTRAVLDDWGLLFADDPS